MDQCQQESEQVIVILNSGLGILYLYPHYAILDIDIQSFRSRKIRSLMELIPFPIHLIDLNKKLCLPNIIFSSAQTLLKKASYFKHSYGYWKHK